MNNDCHQTIRSAPKRIPGDLIMKRLLLSPLAAGLALSFLFPIAASAELPPLIPREVIFGNPTHVGATLSPNGAQLAYLAPDDENVMQVWVKTVGEDDVRQVTQDPERGITNYKWAPSSNQILYHQDTGGDENYHLYIVDLESDETRDLTPFFGVKAAVVAVKPNHPNEILVALNRRNRALFDVYRIDLESGALVLEEENPGSVYGWEVDENLTLRARAFTKNDGGQILEVRDGSEDPWREFLRWGPADRVSTHGFTADGKAI
jgi:dipeptidyl aminopeptidase/acylaminoacyl peptidase